MLVLWANCGEVCETNTRYFKLWCLLEASLDKASFGSAFETDLERRLAFDLALNMAGYRSQFQAYKQCISQQADLVAVQDRCAAARWLLPASGDLQYLDRAGVSVSGEVVSFADMLRRKRTLPSSSASSSTSMLEKERLTRQTLSPGTSEEEEVVPPSSITKQKADEAAVQTEIIPVPSGQEKKKRRRRRAQSGNEIPVPGVTKVVLSEGREDLCI